MAQDLRNLFKESNKSEIPSLKQGHQLRFLEKLESEMPVQSKPTIRKLFWKVAAMITIVLGGGYLSYPLFVNSDSVVIESKEEKTTVKGNLTIGSLSPELNKVEKYYIANINLQLSTLKFNKDNKDLFEGYITRLDELDKAYANLNIELNEHGPTEETITALIDNLKLRLELLFKLKNKLKEIKLIQNGNNTNETI
jgi:hypothetical protein